MFAAEPSSMWLLENVHYRGRYAQVRVLLGTVLILVSGVQVGKIGGGPRRVIVMTGLRPEDQSDRSLDHF